MPICGEGLIKVRIKKVVWAAIILSSTVFWLSAWQIDHIISRFVWQKEEFSDDYDLEIIFLPIIGGVYTKVKAFYCFLFACFVIAYLTLTLSIIGVVE